MIIETINNKSRVLLNQEYFLDNNNIDIATKIKANPSLV
jgi:hypothetical protein